MDPTYRAYNTHVPSYLQGRPRNVIIHCLVREEKAKKKFSPEDITSADKETGIFSVRGKSGYIHTVDFGTQTGKPNCTCQDWAKNNLPCKHFFLIFITTDEWGWSLNGQLVSYARRTWSPLLQVRVNYGVKFNDVRICCCRLLTDGACVYNYKFIFHDKDTYTIM